MNISQVNSTSTPGANGGSSNSYGTNRGNTITHLFDISAHLSSEPLDPDLQALALSLQSDDIGSQGQVIILDLIRLLAQIRKQNQELWQGDAALAYKTAFNVASAQKEHAKRTAISEMISGATSIIQGAVELGVAAVQAKGMRDQLKEIHKEADGMDFSDGAGAGVRSGEVAQNSRPTGAPPAYSEKASPLADDGFEPLPNSKKGDDLEASPETKGNTHPDEQAEVDAAASKAAKRAKAEFINDAARNMYSKMDMHQRVITALVSILTGAGKQFGAWQQIVAGEAQAQATIEQAVMSYLQAQGTYSNEYASEMRDAVRGVLDLIKNIEQARHQASTAIIAIA